MNKRLALLLVLIVSFSYSCQKKNRASSSLTKNNKLEIQQFDFNYLKAKAKIGYLEDNERQNAKANFRIKKDSLIWVQLTGAGGIEGGRCLITKDSLVYVDRINKVYHYFDYAELSKKYKFEISYDILQAIILGEIPYKKVKRSRTSRQDDYFLIKQKDDINTIENYIGRKTQKLEKLEIEQIATRNSLNITYSNFNLVNEMLFSFDGKTTLKYNTGNKTLFTEFSVNFTKVEIPDKPLKFSFTIPQKYEKK